MTQHDPSARGPVPRYSAQARTSHGEWANRPSEVPDPQSVPADWSPSGMTHAGTPGAGYADYPVHPAASGSAHAASGGAHASWEHAADQAAAPGWTGYGPEADPAAGWNGNTGAWTGDGRTAAWNGGPIPDRVPAEWSTPEPPTAAWNAVPEPHPPAWNNAEPPAPTWNAAAEAAPAWGAVVPRPHADPPAHRHPTATPAVWETTAAPTVHDAPAPRSASGARTPKKSKLIFAGALIAAALAGGGAGAGIMAAVGGDSAATAPAGQPPNGQAPGQAPPDGQAPTAQPTKAS
ncbi:hypothetical protein GCM10010112_37640 [Actinoplanes lobatus]|uniref:Uncharacterized protein n=1 Tax=Actinoplanes lobatus TaxID=113568 RepID=A0A7W7HD34_9ACTN|nr:hypothetical protein [Actinoplanes lobatus]MBB4748326.1 hypothetical protein [Actinoplanes lobatus]GGN70779.1 hypothetical protein GCM10010112_37640 [Actinoplanes lobatus]GIE40176.1 hypothetical protein Alo02nite_30740 [Actinoplanes lobatus]